MKRTKSSQRKRQSSKARVSSPLNQQSKDNRQRLFIDPASISTGWAVYEGKTLVDKGTIWAYKDVAIDSRLLYIYSMYSNLLSRRWFHECHIEQLFGKTNVMCHWSVGAIMVAVSPACGSVKADVVGWQKSTNYQKTRKDWKKLGYSSEDEMAAVLMGKFWTEKHL